MIGVPNSIGLNTIVFATTSNIMSNMQFTSHDASMCDKVELTEKKEWDLVVLN